MYHPLLIASAVKQVADVVVGFVHLEKKSKSEIEQPERDLRIIDRRGGPVPVPFHPSPLFFRSVASNVMSGNSFAFRKSGLFTWSSRFVLCVSTLPAFVVALMLTCPSSRPAMSAIR